MTRSFLLLLLFFVAVLTACTKQVPKLQVKDSADYTKAESFLNIQKDSAFYYFNKVATSSKQRLEVALAYNQMAVIQSDAGDYFGSQESLSSSLKYLDSKKPDDHSYLASDYNELGLNSISLKHYNEAVDYFDQALKYTSDTGFRLSILNNIGLSYQQSGMYRQALQIYQTALSQVIKKRTYARIITNIATTKWLSDTAYNAALELKKALAIRITEKDLWGQNSSYLHLADYYMTSVPDSALFYSKSMLTTAIELQSPDNRLEALKRLIRLTESPTAVRKYFLQFTKLSDSVITARNGAKNQFALIRYETEKNKADNLNLQKENTDKKYQIIKQRVLIYGSFLFIVAAAIISSQWYKRRKQKLVSESEAAIHENKLKIYKRVHDVVANGLYTVMSEIDNKAEISKDQILDKIEVLYEQSRGLTYEDSPLAVTDYVERVEALMTAFSTSNRKVLTVGNEAELWNKVSEAAKNEVAHILQELMVNMAKHSGASIVVIKFEQIGNEVNVHYSDDGVGIKGTPKFKNGLSNTGNRIQSIGGRITFDAMNDKGLSILISFPIT